MAESREPRGLDVSALARAGAVVEGRVAVSSLGRLRELLQPGGEAGREVAYRFQGQLRQPVGSEPQVWLHLLAQMGALLECQRCLGPVECPVRVDRAFRFVASEAEALRLDNELEDDVLVLMPRLDGLELLEDELLLALPLVPRHDRCVHAHASEADAEPPAAEHPFAALAALRKAGPRD